MSLSPEERRSEALKHAQWRVKMCDALLIAHRATVPTGPQWRETETEYVATLRAATQERDRLEQGVTTRVRENAAA